MARSSAAPVPAETPALSPDVQEGLARNAISFPDGIPGFDPRLLLDGYRCKLTDTDLRALGADGDSPLLWFAIISEADGVLSANLRAPIVINPQRMIGRQVLPDDG